MTQLLPIALRGILPENMRLSIVKVFAFLILIFERAVHPNNLVKMPNDIVELLVSFEMVFAPSFFNIMPHLLVHLVEEVFILRLVYLHKMLPFQRFTSILKKYVRNHVRPEGTITNSKAYAIEEVIEFYVDVIDDMCWIGLTISCH